MYVCIVRASTAQCIGKLLRKHLNHHASAKLPNVTMHAAMQALPVQQSSSLLHALCSSYNTWHDTTTPRIAG